MYVQSSNTELDRLNPFAIKCHSAVLPSLRVYSIDMGVVDAYFLKTAKKNLSLAAIAKYLIRQASFLNTITAYAVWHLLFRISYAEQDIVSSFVLK